MNREGVSISIFWFVIGLICFVVGGVIYGIGAMSQLALVLVIVIGAVSWIFAILSWRKMRRNENRTGIAYLS